VRALCALAVALTATLALAACGGSNEPAAAPPATTSEPATTTQAGTGTTATEPGSTTEPATEPGSTDGQFDVDEHVEVVNGEAVGGTARVEAKEGDRVRIEVSVDAPQGLHLHAYDIEHEATPQQPAVFELDANLEGIFELESHLDDAVIVKLVVEP
jgi:hypothetical protein